MQRLCPAVQNKNKIEDEDVRGVYHDIREGIYECVMMMVVC